MQLNSEKKAQETVGLYRVPAFPHDFIGSVSTQKDLKEKISNPAFLNAVYVSNPRFYDVLINWLNNKYESDSKEYAKIANTAYKYLSRACFRCTPYGLFSKTFTSKINVKNNSVDKISLPESEVRLIELDAVIIQKIISEIKRSLPSGVYLKYSINNSVVNYGNEILYYNNTIKQDQFIDYELTKIDSHEVLSEILAFFQLSTLKTIYECANYIHSKFPSFELEEIKLYLNELADANILISSLDGCLFSEDPLRSILIHVEELEISTWSQLISELLEQLYNNTKTFFELHTFVKIWLHRIGVDLDPDITVFHIENKAEPCNVGYSPTTSINNSLFKQLTEVRNLLDHLSYGSESNFEFFRKEFKQRYGTQQVLLLDVMNPLKGIGYGLKNEDLYNLPELTGLKYPHKSNSTITLTYFEQILHRALLENTDIIDISVLVKPKDEILRAKKSSKSLTAFTKILNGGKNLFIREFTEISSSRFLNRFAKLHPELKDKLEEICQKENDLWSEKNQILAEFVHIPEVRMTNLLKFNHNRTYQIGSVMSETNNKTINIQLSDLYLQLIDDRFILFSKSKGKEIIPIISNSLSPRAYPMNLYNFIYDLQGENSHFDLYFRWGNLEKLFNYLPKVVYKDIILSPAIWKISKKEISKKENILSWKQKRKIPDKFCIGDSISSDELLYINLTTDIGKQVFFNELNRKENLYALEIIEENQFVSDTAKSGYLHELLIPMLNDSDIVAPSKTEFSNDIKERFSPADNWLYYKLYCTSIWAEYFLKNYFSTLLEDKYIESELKAWFFIRYQDHEGYHLRIRFNIDKCSDGVKFMAKVTQFFNRYAGSFQISKVVIDTYEREIDRYGFSNIVYCENLFFYDSENVLQIIKDDPQDKFMVAVCGIDNYLNIFELSDSDKERLLENLSVSFLNEFNGDKEFRKQMNVKYRVFSSQISNTLNDRNSETNAVFQKNYHRMKEEAAKIKLPRKETLEVVASLIHMFLNRLLTSNPRYNEMFIYHIMAKHYKRVNQLNKQKQHV